MKCHEDIKGLSADKIIDAQCLCDNGRYDAAYYIGGYAAELLIKAKVCKNLGIEDFFDFDNPNKKKIKNDGSLFRPFRVHDLEQLLVLSGIYTQFQTELLVNTPLKAAWSILTDWNENSRYLTGKSEADVKNLLTSINEFKVWILKYL